MSVRLGHEHFPNKKSTDQERHYFAIISMVEGEFCFKTWLSYGERPEMANLLPPILKFSFQEPKRGANDANQISEYRDEPKRQRKGSGVALGVLSVTQMVCASTLRDVDIETRTEESMDARTRGMLKVQDTEVASRWLALTAF
jgi:hypothetical protein